MGDDLRKYLLITRHKFLNSEATIFLFMWWLLLYNFSRVGKIKTVAYDFLNADKNIQIIHINWYWHFYIMKLMWFSTSYSF